MRTILPNDIEEMADKIRPYYRQEGNKCFIDPKAPPEILDMGKKVISYLKEQQRICDEMAMYG